MALLEVENLQTHFRTPDGINRAVDVPILAFGGDVAAGPIGARGTLADIGATIAHRLGLPLPAHGASWLT